MLHHIEAGKLVSELAMVARYAQHIPGTVSCSLRRFRPWREIITEYGLATLMAELAQDIVGDGIIESAVWAMDLAGFTHGCRAGWLPWWLAGPERGRPTRGRERLCLTHARKSCQFRRGWTSRVPHLMICAPGALTAPRRGPLRVGRHRVAASENRFASRTRYVRENLPRPATSMPSNGTDEVDGIEN